jgi:hypothetical protein
MASEIDTTDKLFEANKDGYNSFGAGGFFGDSVKVWGESVNSNSMAVKAVKVTYGTDARTYNFSGLPYIEYIDITGYNFIEKKGKVYIIDFGDAIYKKKDKEMNWFLSYFLGGHNGWNPDFK